MEIVNLCCINGYFAWDSRVRLSVLLMFNLHTNWSSNYFIIWLCVCRPRSCQWNSCWSSTKKRSCDQRGTTSLFSSTESFRNSNINPVLHKQKQFACCGFFRWLPVAMEYENFEAGVSRFLCMTMSGLVGISGFNVRKYVKENFFRDWNSSM